MGPRAFAEFGREQLITFIAESLGQTPDPAVLMELREEEQKEAEAAAEADDDGGGGGGASAAAGVATQ